MGIVSGNKPSSGDPMYVEHAAVPAGAFEGELYVADPSTSLGGVELGVSGSVPAADYQYKYTFVITDPVTGTVLAETAPASASGTITVSTGPDQIGLASIDVSSNPHVNARRIYRDDGVTGTFRLLGTISDNVTTTFTDNVASTSGQPTVPSSNNTGQGLTIHRAQAGDVSHLEQYGATPTVTFKRRVDGIVLGEGGGPWRMYARYTSPVQVDNSASKTELMGTYILLTDSLGVDGGVRLESWGYLENTSGSDNDLTFYYSLDNAVTDHVTGTLTVPNGFKGSYWIDMIAMFDSGSTQTWMGKGLIVDQEDASDQIQFAPANASSPNASYLISLVNSVSPYEITSSHAGDSTVTRPRLHVKWASADAASIIRQNYATLWYMPPTVAVA